MYFEKLDGSKLERGDWICPFGIGIDSMGAERRSVSDFRFIRLLPHRGIDRANLSSISASRQR